MFQLKLFTQAHFQTTPAPNDKIMISPFFGTSFYDLCKKNKNKIFCQRNRGKKGKRYIWCVPIF